MKTALLALPVLAIIAVAGIVAAQPYWNPDDMTQEQKDFKVQMLELKQEMIQDKIAYLNGELTEEEVYELMEQHFEAMSQLREQFKDISGIEGDCTYGKGHKGMEFGKGMGMKGMHRMGW